MVYRFTKDRKFLDFAEKVTDIYLKRLKETSDDWVPLWDMDAQPTAVDCNVGNDGAYKGIPKDASAAAVVAGNQKAVQCFFHTIPKKPPQPS